MEQSGNKKSNMSASTGNDRAPPSGGVGSGRRISWMYFFVVAAFAVKLAIDSFVFEKRSGSQIFDNWQSSMDWTEGMPFSSMSAVPFSAMSDTKIVAAPPKTTVAYAVTITKFSSGKNNPKNTLLDRAAVLQQSLKVAMGKSERYDYHIYAFVHPEAIEVKPRMEQLGYRVQVHDTPFNISEIQNEELIRAQNNGCCQEKEYLKLYTYLLLDYPVAVHVDMDYLFLKPMDDLFDVMIDSSPENRAKFQKASMWTEMQSYNGSIDFMFTRDYNMVDPPRRQPHQIGVQGGFLVIRPSQDDFQKFVDVILSGGDFKGSQWGGPKLGYGGYYGSGTIQGLAAYYYGHLEPNRAIELNRCYYNAMVDAPTAFKEKKNKTLCRTLEETCQDCRETKLDEIYSVHFTVCGKPEWCHMQNKVPLCMELMTEWHKVRTLVEQEWSERYPAYDPGFPSVGNGTDDLSNRLRRFDGHCARREKDGKIKYSPMVFPSDTEQLL